MSRLALSWSGGKDSAWALLRLLGEGHEVAALITTVARDRGRVTGHGVRRSLIRFQAAALRLPLLEVGLPEPCSNELYRFAWSSAVTRLRDRSGVTGVAFGDLFLADLRAWRESLVGSLGMAATFPLWGMRSDLLAAAMLRAGIEAQIVCLDPSRVERRWAGALWDAEFLDALDPAADPCGERGEFHTFVTAGPMFSGRVDVETGAIEDRDGLVFADLSLRQEPGPIWPTPSPCRNVCRTGADGRCDGCGRTLPEIAGWVGLPESRRQAVMERVRFWQPRLGPPDGRQTSGSDSPADGQGQPRSR